MEGRNLWALLDWIGLHRMAWLREWPQAREASEGMATVIYRISRDRTEAER